MVNSNSCAHPNNIRKLAKTLDEEGSYFDQGRHQGLTAERYPLRGPNDDGFTSSVDTARLRRALEMPTAGRRILDRGLGYEDLDQPTQTSLSDRQDISLRTGRGLPSAETWSSSRIAAIGYTEPLARINNSPIPSSPTDSNQNILR